MSLGYRTYSTHTFDSIIPCHGNRDAIGAAKGFTCNNPNMPELLLFHGRTGTGKTHLLQAIQNQLHICNSALKVIYFTARDFAHLLQAGTDIHGKDMPLEIADVTLLDDIHLIATGSELADCLATYINRTLGPRYSMVMTSLVHPSKLPLVKHIESKLPPERIYQVAPLQRTALMEVLRERNRFFHFGLKDTELCWIADTIRRPSVRALEASLLKAVAIRHRNKSVTG